MHENICTVALTSLSHDGRAVGRVLADATHSATPLHGGVIFVSDALPGQTVRAKILKSKKSFAEATCLEVLDNAPQERPAPCPHHAHCGGCTLQNLPYSTQLYWKEQIVREALSRIAKLPEEELCHVQAIIPSPAEWEYRNKMEFAFGHSADKHALLLGLRAKASHAIISVPQCRLMPENCLRIVNTLKQLCEDAFLQAWHENSSPNGILRHAVLRISHDGKAHVTLITSSANAAQTAQIKELGRQLLHAHGEIMGFVHAERRSQAMIAEGEHIAWSLGSHTLHERLCNTEYRLGHDAFFQINTAAAEILAKTVYSAAASALGNFEKPCLWDVYCGVGAPGLGLAPLAHKVYGVEINPKAIDMAKENAVHAGFKHYHYVAGDAKKVIKGWPQPTLILLDPPRAGLHPDIVAQILRCQAPYIIYISCNPATLARDLGLLKQSYCLEKLIPFDFFPHTPHVESCAVLHLKK